MELINKAVACKTIFDTGAPINGPSVLKQSRWFVAYCMRILKLPREEIFDKWLKIFHSDATSHEDYAYVFDRTYERYSQSVRFQRQYNATIYEGEIQLINECALKSLWQKQFLLLLLVYAKMTHIFCLDNVSPAPFTKYLKKTNASMSPKMCADVLDEAMRIGLISSATQYDVDDVTGTKIETTIYQIHVFEYGKKMFTLWSAYDLAKYSDMIQPKLKCANCGEMFDATGCCQRTICLSCWKTKEKSRVREAARISMEKSRSLKKLTGI